MADDGTAAKRAKARILEWLEVLAKLVGASAVVLVALFANALQSRLTGVSVQSQREQAESQLRASMFNSLIRSSSGPQRGDQTIPVHLFASRTERHPLSSNTHL